MAVFFSAFDFWDAVCTSATCTPSGAWSGTVRTGLLTELPLPQAFRLADWACVAAAEIAITPVICRGKRARANVHPGHAERAVSVCSARNASPPSIRGNRADAIGCRWISYLQWRRHGERHRDIPPRRRNRAGEWSPPPQLYGQCGLYGQLHSDQWTILRYIHRARWRVIRRNIHGSTRQWGVWHCSEGVTQVEKRRLEKIGVGVEWL